jgi:hypothetical protein
MEKNGYRAMKSEKTIFMKRDGDEFIIHGGTACSSTI